MTSKAHALSREELIRALTAYSGITTADGAGDGTTLIASDLIGRNDFISEKTVYILSGDAKDEDKGALSFNSVTGAITLRGTGVSAQIVTGVIFRILNISSVEVDVANIQEDLGDMADAAATGPVTATDNLMAYVKQIINEILGTDGAWGNLNNEAINSLDLAIQYIAAVMGFNGANVFNPSVGGVARTNMDAVFAALDVLIQTVDDNVDWIKEAAGNDNWGFGALRNHILTNKALIETVDTIVDLIFAGLGHDTWGLGAIHNDITNIVDQPPVAKSLHDILHKNGSFTFDNTTDALEALSDKLGAFLGTGGANQDESVISSLDLAHTDLDFIRGALIAISQVTAQEQADTAVNINAINGSETNVFDLSTASTRYIVRSLRLKCADPGANTVTVRLYELVNDGLTEVDSFDMNTDNFGTYQSLMDMFGLAQLAGDNLKVTVRASAGGPYAVTGQYSHAKTE